jgi:hypothetical protein
VLPPLAAVLSSSWFVDSGAIDYFPNKYRMLRGNAVP